MVRIMIGNEILGFSVGLTYTYWQVACHFKNIVRLLFTHNEPSFKKLNCNFKTIKSFLAYKNFSFTTVCQIFLPLSLIFLMLFYFR